MTLAGVTSDVKTTLSTLKPELSGHHSSFRILRDLDGAREHFAEAARLDPHDAILEANLAGVYIRQDRFLEARHAIDRALALDPDNYLANENLLTLLRKQKDGQAEQQAQRFAALTQKLSEDQALLFRHIEVAQ